MERHRYSFFGVTELFFSFRFPACLSPSKVDVPPNYIQLVYLRVGNSNFQNVCIIGKIMYLS